VASLLRVAPPGFVNAGNNKGLTPLLLAVGLFSRTNIAEPEGAAALTRIVDLLVAAGAAVDAGCMTARGTLCRPLLVAARLGLVGVVHTLLLSGADPRGSLQDPVSSRPIDQAVRHQHWAVVRLLLQGGSSPTARTPYENCLLSHILDLRSQLEDARRGRSGRARGLQ
jgi:hypothetical protein